MLFDVACPGVRGLRARCCVCRRRGAGAVPAAPNSTATTAFGINDDDTDRRQLSLADDGIEHAFFGTLDGNYTSFDAGDGGSEARAINNNGTIVGFSNSQNGIDGRSAHFRTACAGCAEMSACVNGNCSAAPKASTTRRTASPARAGISRTIRRSLSSGHHGKMAGTTCAFRRCIRPAKPTASTAPAWWWAIFPPPHARLYRQRQQAADRWTTLPTAAGTTLGASTTTARPWANG